MCDQTGLFVYIQKFHESAAIKAELLRANWWHRQIWKIFLEGGGVTN